MPNLPTADIDTHAPFIDQKNSGCSVHEQSRYTVDFYATVKARYVTS